MAFERRRLYRVGIDRPPLSVEIREVFTPIQIRWAVTIGIVALLAFIIVPDLFKSTDTPLQPGGRMVFGVSEAAPGKAKAYPLRVMLHERNEGALELQVKAEHGERFILVNRQLQPMNPMENIEFPLALGGEITPGALWIPSAEREIGGMSEAGLVRRVTKYKSFKVVAVEGVEGGTRFFELETGLLVGFEIKVGRKEIVGSLLSIN
ncbi:MAG: hypothetical protein AAF449_14840 [Myxococcota bacterium]